jgi:glycosyltransferase involved in cell wall biosynthesis
MLGLRHIPLKYRLPLIHGGLNLLARLKSSGWTKAAESKPVAGDFVVSAFFNETTGIAQGGRLSAQGFKAGGYDIIEHDLRDCFDQFVFGGAPLPGKGGVWYIHANAPEVLVALMAHDYVTWADRYRIAYWAWETPKAPASWIFAADYLHEIWVPSRFVHDALVTTFNEAERADLIPRLRVMPHPVPLPPPMRHEMARQRFGLQDGVCEVLSLFDAKSSAVRKNPWGVLEAWQQAFPEPSPHARLTLKVSDPGRDRSSADRLLALVATRDDIRLTNERLSERDMEAFIGAFDVLISLHRSEGFGLTLAEAMAAGVAVIATGWSGNSDFMTTENSRPVSSTLVPVYDPEGAYTLVKNDPAQVWAEPDNAEAAQALHELADHPDLRQNLSAAAVQSIRALHIPWHREALVMLLFNGYL